jgi:Flp pilus assembly protein TadD
MKLLTATVVSVVLFAADARAQAAPPRHLVVPFENTSRDAARAWLTEGAAVLLTDDLLALGMPAITRDDRLRAFDRLNVPPVASLSLATVIRIGQLVGAGQVVTGSFESAGDNVIVRARSLRIDTGRLSPEIVERGVVTDIYAVFARVARRIAPDSPISAAEMEAGHPPQQAFEQYIKGVLAESPATQIAFITQALRLAPEFQRARMELWRIHTEASDHLSALAVIRQVPDGHRLERQAGFLEALSLLNLGQYQAAFTAFIDLNQQSPDAALINNLGIVQLRRPTGTRQQGRPVQFFEQALKIDPADSDLFFNIGYAYWLEKDLDGAVYWLRETVRRNPADDEAHYVLGVALQAAGNATEAAREKELARQLSSAHMEWEATQNGANTVPPSLERVKTDIDLPAALRVEDAVVAAGQRDQRELAVFHLDRGRRFFEEERDSEAIAELRRTIFLSPYDSEAHLLLAQIYLRTGRTEEAIDALKIAVWSDPMNDEAKELLGELVGTAR